MAEHPGPGPWFAGARFSLLDATFAPVRRCLAAVERVGAFGFLGGLGGVGALAGRASVCAGVAQAWARFVRHRLGAA